MDTAPNLCSSISSGKEIMKALIVVSYASWISEDFRSALDPREWAVIKDYGFDMPSDLDKYDAVAWWMNAQHAARVIRANPQMGFIAPGPAWLSGVPKSLTKRDILTSTVHDFLQGTPAGSFWVKPAEAKIEGFEAGWRNATQTLEAISSMHLPMESYIQWSTTLLDINWEHRFYVLDGEVLTGSPYLVDGVTYYDGASWDRYEEAYNYAVEAVKELGEHQPPAYTLDVGLDAERGWLVIEGNPAWSSGIYGGSPEKVAEVLINAYQGKSVSEYAWKPDQYLVNIAERKPLLR